MKLQIDKTEKVEKAGYKTITSSSAKYSEDSVSYLDDNYGNYSSDWQIRISISPEEDNLQKAYNVLAKYFRDKETRLDFEVKCLLLPKSDENSKNVINNWDPVHFAGHDRSQRGREVCIYIGLKGKNKDNIRQFIKKPDEWKVLMLDLWKALQDADVAIGYTPAPSGDKVIPSEVGLLVPFSYTSFKPFKLRHGILKQEHYNPMAFDDPLDGMTEITWGDLSEFKIKHDIVKKQIIERIQDTETHLNYMKLGVYTKLRTINELASFEQIHAPFNSVAQVVGLDPNTQLMDQDAIDEILKIKMDFKAVEVTEYLGRLNIAGIDIDNCIDKAPSEMQKIYRAIIHALHEKAALAKDILHNDVQSLKQAQRGNETFKDLAIVSGGFLGSIAVGASIGALIGTFALPLVGTAAGAAIGAFFGGAIGMVATGYQALIRNRLFGGNYIYAEMAASTIWTTLGFAGLGAVIGTLFFPGMGTVIGAGVGLCAGGLVSVVTGWLSDPTPAPENMPIQLDNQDVEDIGNVPYNNLYINPLLHENIIGKKSDILVTPRSQDAIEVKPVVKQYDMEISISLLDGNVITLGVDLAWSVEELKENLFEEMEKKNISRPEDGVMYLIYNGFSILNHEVLRSFELTNNSKFHQIDIDKSPQLKTGL